MNTSGAGKRKAGGMEAIAEAKRGAHTSFNSAKPTRSVPAAPVASSAPAASFASEGHKAAPAAGLGPGEETFEDIAARTGATMVDILNKKMAFKKGTRAEKKVEDMVPMIKELR